MEIANDMPEGAPIINIEGRKGESLFYRPLIWGIKEELKLISKQYTEYERIIREAKEERLLGLVGAISMEEALDFILEAYIPDYRGLEPHLSPSLKIRLTRSLNIIPAQILDAADLINSVRNKFAHELKISCFDALDSGTKGNLKQKHSMFFPNDTNTDSTFADIFSKVVDAVIIGLEIYASNLRIAREYIYSDDFGKELVKRIKEKK
jgi:hypothetical protein